MSQFTVLNPATEEPVTTVTQATTLNAGVFTCSPIKSRRLMSSNMKIRTTGSQTPLPTCERTRIFSSGARGIRMTAAPTTIIPV